MNGLAILVGVLVTIGGLIGTIRPQLVVTGRYPLATLTHARIGGVLTLVFGLLVIGEGVVQ